MVKIADIKERSGIRGISIDVEVVDKPKPKTIVTRFGNELYVADLTIKDDSGEMILTLWNEDIDKVSKGSWIVIDDGFTNIFRGTVKLNISRQGKLIELCNEPCAPDFRIACDSPKETCDEHMYDIMKEDITGGEK